MLTADLGAEPPAHLMRATGALVGLDVPHLTEAPTSSRRLRLAACVREWTVGAEIQALQLGPRLAVAHGVHVTAHVEPAYAGCADSHDVEVLRTDDGPVIDVAVLDADVTDGQRRWSTAWLSAPCGTRKG